MKRPFLGFVCFGLVTALGGLAFSADQSQDETEIRKVMMALDEAWNRHDMKAFASQFAEDADQVNVAGWWWKGRPEIEKKLTAAHAFIFRESTHTDNEVYIKFLTPQIAVVHVLWSIVGDLHRDGTPAGTPAQPRKGIQTQVLQKLSGKWMIVAFHNTNRLPEEPFPPGPPKK
jgi:uncharacterized protein (TIGR02246 family)